MKKKLNIFFLLTVLAVGAVRAQEVILVENDSNRMEPFDMPEGMIVSEEDLMNDYNNREGLTDGNAATVRTLSYDDSVIVSRLSRIPTTIEMPLNNVTRKFIDSYSNRMKGSVSVMLGAANFYMPIFEEALERYGLPLELKYLPVIESALRPTATSRMGAAGLWQFMIGTGKRYGLEVNTLVDERRDPVKSSEAAAHYLSDLYDQFGDWGLAIAAYNCGEGNIQKAIVRNGNQEGADYWDVYNRLPHETRGYVPAFIAANYIMNYYCEHGIVPREATLPLETDTVVVQADVKFDRIAQLCNVTTDELRAINPQYRKDIVPANYTLRLPVVAVEPFLTYEDSIYGSGDISALRRAVTEDLVQASESVSTRSHGRRGSRSSRRNRNSGTKSVSVRSGDSLSTIAKRNGTTVSKLKKLNGMRGDMIRPGQKIRVK
ncbi:MAG: transglycosylase SLT domain-containing protein [Bacteroidaceae bacterium]|nr:transglycosylase SLT domain-containing protein [Bacteroidaceae bacterium]